MVVTASQTAHPELTAPASVSYVTREDLDNLVVNDIAEAIRKLPGININPGTSYGRNEIKIRGLAADYTLLLINGRRINSRDALTSAYGNDFDLSSIPMSAVERIEVIRGPMSSLYGADALGGVVNVILRQPTEEVQGSVGYQYDGITEGSGGDTHKLNAFVSGALIPDTLLANLIVEKSDRDAWRTSKSVNPDTDVLEERDELSVFSNLKWLVNQQQDIDLDLLYSKDERDADWNNWGRAVNNVQELERYNVALTHHGYWENVESRLRYSFDRSELMDDSELNRAIGDIAQTNNTVDVQLSGYVGDHLLTGGAEYRDTKLKNNLTLGSDSVNYSQAAVYLQDEFSLGDLAITLGGRFDDHEVYGGEFSPRAYAVYKMNENWVVKGGVGKAFKAPSLNQYSDAYSVLACRGACFVVGNPNLKAETAISYELGTSYEADRWGAGLTVFENDIDDMIQAENWDRVKTELSHFNVDEAEVKGVETMAWFDVTDTVSVSVNYLYTHAEDKKTGKDLILTPQHTANVQLDWQAMDNLYAYTSYQYTGEQSVRSGEKLDGYGTMDLGARYEAVKNLNLKLGVTNVTDEERDETATKLDYILKARSIYAGVSYDF
ncbi:TonB-dependent receptor domain-containing protein [Photobacterium sp. TY1-4]|uniref:TonB-dependent receptor domain-containing protein n=1 Tax=Photobacterium sp. TY1-4 TaxID=2899122 RepID=UPI0021C0666D|nr:TonB-dependent receptor [Photobacterium sp. TY1-4]UXH99925.1 TonB-dependent receptor [Photobacterium sp. TY1-4]